MKNFSLSLLLFLSSIEASFFPALVATQTLLTTKLKNNSMIDVMKLESEDTDVFACAKELWIKTFLEVYKEYTAEQLYLEDKPDYLKNLIETAFEGEENDFNNKKEDSIFVVARDTRSNEIIGFASYDTIETSEDRVIYIRQLAIDHAYRNQGLGRTLVLDMIKMIAPQNQSVIVTVCTRKINEFAISFYHKLNFQDAPMKEVHPELPEYKFCGLKLTIEA
jgi:ribosomal protein S18 acetylase RimI-like enzyme